MKSLARAAKSDLILEEKNVIIENMFFPLVDVERASFIQKLEEDLWPIHPP